MAQDARRHTVPAGGDTPKRAWFNDLAASIRDVVTVADVADRGTLVAALTAAGIGPSPARPVYVHRTNAAAGSELEVTIDGQTWRTITSALIATGAPTMAAGYTGSSITLTRVAGWVSVRGRISGSIAANSQITVAAIGGIPDGFRPPGTIPCAAFTGVNGASSLVQCLTDGRIIGWSTVATTVMDFAGTWYTANVM